MSTTPASATEHGETVHEKANSGQKVGNKLGKNDMAGKAATIVAVGVVAALIAPELIPGIAIGVVAAFLPGIGGPMFKSAAERKNREKMAEATQPVKEAVAEAHPEHETKADTPGQTSTPAAAAAPAAT